MDDDDDDDNDDGEVDLQSYLTMESDQQPEVLCYSQDQTVISEISEITRGRPVRVPVAVVTPNAKSSLSIQSSIEGSIQSSPLSPQSCPPFRNENAKPKNDASRKSKKQRPKRPSKPTRKAKPKRERKVSIETSKDGRTVASSDNTLPPDHAYSLSVDPQIVSRFRQDKLLTSYLSSSFRDVWKYKYDQDNPEIFSDESAYVPPVISASHALQLIDIDDEIETTEGKAGRLRRQWIGLIACLSALIICLVGAALLWIFLISPIDRGSAQLKEESTNPHSAAPNVTLSEPSLATFIPLERTPTPTTAPSNSNTSNVLMGQPESLTTVTPTSEPSDRRVSNGPSRTSESLPTITPTHIPTKSRISIVPTRRPQSLTTATPTTVPSKNRASNAPTRTPEFLTTLAATNVPSKSRASFTPTRRPDSLSTAPNMTTSSPSSIGYTALSDLPTGLPDAAYLGWSIMELNAYDATVCELSGDGKTLAFVNATHVWALKIGENSTLAPLGVPKTPQTPPLSLQLSYNASIMVVSRPHTFNPTFTAVSAYRWDGSDYQSVETWVYASWERELSFGVSADGAKVAVCDSALVELYAWEGDSYVKSSEINASGTSQLTMAEDGKRLAVIDSENGVVVYLALPNIFKNETNWINYKLNVSHVSLVAISKDGYKVACVTPQDGDTTTTGTGSIINIYEYRDQQNDWSQLGPSIRMNATVMSFEMATNGLTIAFRAQDHIRIVSYQGGEWRPLEGGEVTAQFESSSGKILALSDDGDVLVFAGRIQNGTIQVLTRANSPGQPM